MYANRTGIPFFRNQKTGHLVLSGEEGMEFED
jgi:hypothetical protein